MSRELLVLVNLFSEFLNFFAVPFEQVMIHYYKLSYKSNVIKFANEIFVDLGGVQHFGVEFGQIFGVLHDSRHFNRASPIDIIEALAID